MLLEPRIKLSPTLTLPCDIADYWKLRDATACEISENTQRYENIFKHHEFDYENPKSAKTLPFEHLTLLVFEHIEIEGRSMHLGRLQDALFYLDHSLLLGGLFEERLKRICSHTAHLGIAVNTFAYADHYRERFEFREDDLAFLNTLYSKYYDAFDKSSLRDAARNLRDIALNSKYVIPNFMSVIEGALTTTDANSDLQNTISRKMRYVYEDIFDDLELCKHLEKPDWNKLSIKETDARVVWKQLYHLRSLIIHGSHPNFGHGELNRIPDFRTAQKILMSGVKALTMLQVEKPEVFGALRI